MMLRSSTKTLSLISWILCFLSLLHIALALPAPGPPKKDYKSFRNFLLDEIDGGRLNPKKLVFYTTRDSRDRKTYGREQASAFLRDNPGWESLDDVMARKYNVDKFTFDQREDAWEALASVAEGEPLVFAPKDVLRNSAYKRVVEKTLNRRLDKGYIDALRMIRSKDPPASRPPPESTQDDGDRQPPRTEPKQPSRQGPDPEKQRQAEERERQRQNKWAEERAEQFRKENEEADRKERQKARQQKAPEQPSQSPADDADADPNGYYKALGVSSAATDTEIKKAYRKLALSSHPDRNPDDPGAKARFQTINEANEVLGDPVKRAEYDAAAKLESLRKKMGGFDFDADNFNRGPPTGAFRPEPNPPRGQSSSYYTREARPSWADSEDEGDRRDSRRRRPPPRAPPPETEEIPEGRGWTRIASPNARGVWYNDGRAVPRGFYKKMGPYWASVRDPDLGSRACKRSPDGTCATGPGSEGEGPKVRKRPSRSSSSEAQREAASGDDEGGDGEGFGGDDQGVKPGTKSRNMKPTGGAPKKDSSSDSRRTSSKPPPRPPPTRPT